MSEADDKFIEKLQKMKAMAHDPSLTESEAALWAEKLASLLAERGLSMMDLNESERQDQVSEQIFEMMYSDPWRMSLFRAAEKLYFCYSFKDQHLISGQWRWGRVVVGRPHNVVTLIETYQYLEQTTLRLARLYVRTEDVENDIRLGGTTSRAARIGFERGCGVRLAERLWQRYLEQTKETVETSKNPHNLPALYKSELALAKETAQKNHPNLKTMNSRGSSINNHGTAGKTAADGVSLSGQISGAKSKGNLLS